MGNLQEITDIHTEIPVITGAGKSFCRGFCGDEMAKKQHVNNRVFCAGEQSSLWLFQTKDLFGLSEDITSTGTVVRPWRVLEGASGFGGQKCKWLL